MQTSQTSLTTPSTTDTLGDGYIVVAPISSANQQKIHQLQDALQAAFPKAKFWFPKNEQLHITFAHIITPNTTYAKDPKDLFAKLSSQAIDALRQTVPAKLHIPINFDRAEASALAVILKGTDDGTYDSLRQQFVSKFTLPVESRRPPTIIHSTIARYYGAYDLDEIQRFVADLNVSFTQTTDELQLIHEKKIFAQEYDILETFPS